MATRPRWQPPQYGNVLVDQGDRQAALRAYRKSLEITAALAEGDPANAGWRRDLAFSHDRIGDMLVAQGNGQGPGCFPQERGNRTALAERDPLNTQWQRDLSISYWKIARLGEVVGSVEARRTLLQKGLDILIRQRDLNQLPEPNARGSRGFSTRFKH
jgi:hypothetical protein